MQKRPEILIIKLSAIGDVIHTLPALCALKNAMPHARVTWLVEEAASSLVLGHEDLDRVIVSRRKAWAKGLLKGSEYKKSFSEIRAFLKELRDTRYDAVIDFQFLIKSGVMAALARGERKIGFGKGMDHMEHSYVFYNERFPAVSMEVHALIRNLMLLKVLGITPEESKTDSSKASKSEDKKDECSKAGCTKTECAKNIYNRIQEVEYRLPISDKDREAATGLLKPLKAKCPGGVIAVNPAATWDTKLWDVEKFAIVADRLIEQFDVGIALTGGPEDFEMNSQVVSKMKKDALNLAGKTSLKELGAVYEKCNCLVTTDTGPMHLGAAVGIPVVAVFGPTAPWRTGPFGRGHRVVRAGLECSPCFKRTCETKECMTAIKAEDVLKNVAALNIWK